MSDTPADTTADSAAQTAQDAATLPLFYSAPTALMKDQHADLALAPQSGFDFASKANVIPLMAAEMPQAARSYPIVFSGPNNMPLAVTGLKADENLFVDADGNWAAGHYVPAYVRRYPFVLAGDDADEQLTLCIDMNAPMVAKRGDEGAHEIFTQDGEASEFTQNALRFCEEFQAMFNVTRTLVTEIVAQDILMDQQSKVTLPDGTSHNITGFKGIDEAKLNALDDDAFLKLRKTGALGAIYCQLASSNTWQSLLALRNT